MDKLKLTERLKLEVWRKTFDNNTIERQNYYYVEILAAVEAYLVNEENLKDKDRLSARLPDRHTIRNFFENKYKHGPQQKTLDVLSSYVLGQKATFTAFKAWMREHKDMDVPQEVLTIQPKSGRKWLVGQKQIVIGGILLLFTLGILFWLMSFQDRQDIKAKKIYEERLAVLPFENKSHDATLNQVGGYLADVIIKGLEAFDKVKVTSRETVQSYAEFVGILPNNAAGKPSFFELTGAKYLISGHYYDLPGDSLELHLYISNTTTGEVVHEFDIITSSIFAKEQLAERVRQVVLGYLFRVKQLQIMQANDELKHVPAYDAVAIHHEAANNLYTTHWDTLAVRFGKAYQLDTNYFDPLFMQCWIYYVGQNKSKLDSNLNILAQKSDQFTTTEKASFDYFKAVSNGDEKDIFLAAYRFYQRDPKNFISIFLAGTAAMGCGYFDKALEIFEPVQLKNYSEINRSTFYNLLAFRVSAYNVLGRHEEALELLKDVPVDTRYQKIHAIKIRSLIHTGAPAQAKAYVESTCQYHPNCDFIYRKTAEEFILADKPEYVSDLVKMAEAEFVDVPMKNKSLNLAYCYLLDGQYDKLDTLLRVYDTSNIHPIAWNIILGLYHAHKGEPEKAKDFIQKILDSNHKGREYWAVGIYCQLGELEAAMDMLRTSYENNGYFEPLWSHNLDVYLKPLFDYPPYVEFMASIINENSPK